MPKKKRDLFIVALLISLLLFLTGMISVRHEDEPTPRNHINLLSFPFPKL